MTKKVIRSEDFKPLIMPGYYVNEYQRLHPGIYFKNGKLRRKRKENLTEENV